MSREIFEKIDEEFFTTILDEDFKFEGHMKFEDSTIIKGNIKGKIESKADLIIGPNAIIEADVYAKKLECFGKIYGDIKVDDEVYFHSPSQLRGSLISSLITFEKGCFINGEVRMIGDEEENKYLNKSKQKKSK